MSVTVVSLKKENTCYAWIVRLYAFIAWKQIWKKIWNIFRSYFSDVWEINHHLILVLKQASICLGKKSRQVLKPVALDGLFCCFSSCLFLCVRKPSEYKFMFLECENLSLVFLSLWQDYSWICASLSRCPAVSPKMPLMYKQIYS